MPWWGVLAIAGGAITGLGIAYLLGSAAGMRGGRGSTLPTSSAGVSERERGHLHREAEAPRSRYVEDNKIAWNPAAFLAAGALIGGLSALAIGLALG